MSEHVHDFRPRWRCEHLGDWTRGIPEDTPLLDTPCGKGRVVYVCRCGESGYPIVREGEPGNYPLDGGTRRGGGLE